MERITIAEKFTCGHVGLNSILPSSRSSQPSRNLWSRVRRLATSPPSTSTRSIQRDEPCSKCQAEQQRLKEANELDLQDLSHAADFWKTIHEAHVANGQRTSASRCELCIAQRHAFSVLCGGSKNNEALDDWNSSPALSFSSENSSEVSQYHDAVSKQSTSPSSSSPNSADQELSGVSSTGLTISDDELLNLPALPEQTQDEIESLKASSSASSSTSKSCHWTQRRIIDPDTAEGQLEISTSFYHGRRIIDPDTEEGQSELQELSDNGITPSPIVVEPRIIDPDTPEGQAELLEIDEAKARPIRAYFGVPDTALPADLPDHIEQKVHPWQYGGKYRRAVEYTETAYLEISKASYLLREKMVNDLQEISQQDQGPTGKSDFWSDSDSDDENDDAVSDVSLLSEDDDDESRAFPKGLEESWRAAIEDDLYDAKPIVSSTLTEQQIALLKPTHFNWDDEDEELSNTKTTASPASPISAAQERRNSADLNNAESKPTPTSAAPISAAQERRNSAAEAILNQELTKAGYTSELPDSVWQGSSTVLFDAEVPPTPTQAEFPPLPLPETDSQSADELFDIYCSYEDRTEPVPLVAPPRPERPEENLDEFLETLKEQEKVRAIEAAKPPQVEERPLTRLEERRAAQRPSRLSQVVSAEELEEPEETWV